MSEIPESNSQHDPQLAALYRAAAAEQPPATLDAAVLAAAHRAVGARPQPTDRAAPRWRLPLATAALIVLSASLVITMYQEAPPELAPPVPSRQDIPAPPPGPSKEEGARDSAVNRQNLAEPASVAGSEGSTAAAAKAVTPSPFPAAPVAAERATDNAAADARTATVGRAERSAGTAAGAMAPAPAATTASSAPSALKDRLSDHLSTEQRAKAESVLPQSLTADAASAPALTPESWLEQILTLRRQGQVDRAKARFAEFRKRYPDYPLPPALQDWAPLLGHPAASQ